MIYYIWKYKKKLIPYVLFFIGFYLLIYLVFRYFDITQDRIQELIGPFGALGLVVVFLLQILFAMTPLPDASLTVIAVILFGPFWGIVPIFAGLLLSSIFHYLIAKRLGRAYIIKKFPNSEKFFDQVDSSTSIFELVLFRMFSLIAFDITSYLAGIGGVSFKKFLLAAILGLVPIVATPAFIAIGLLTDNIFQILLLFVLYLLFILALALLHRRKRIKTSV